MNTHPAQTSFAATRAAVTGRRRAPLCFVVDEDRSIRRFLSLILHGSGIDTEEFADSHGIAEACKRRMPRLVFLDVALDSTEAVKAIAALAAAGFTGPVQIMSGRGVTIAGQVKHIGERQRLRMLPPLKKPFETAAVAKILAELKLGEPPARVGRIDLDQALNGGWIEFWYQPRIDLRRKQLVGAEAMARARHPQSGVLVPGAFLPGATAASLGKLGELALTQALEAGLKFARLGLNLPLSVNIAASVLDTLPIADIVESYRPKFEKWPGLTIDLMEEQIITELALASEMAKKLEPLGVALAIDHFGRGFPQLARLDALPFAEIKLDRNLITHHGTDKVNAPLCKSIIGLAHGFGRLAVGIGIERASEALTLLSLGCDHGQGFLLGQPMREDRFVSLLRQRSAAHGGPPSKPTQARQTAPA